MKNTFDIIDRIFSLLYVSAVRNTIDGSIYRNKRPLGNETRDIVIVALPISGGADLQEGTFFVNCFVKNQPNGQPNESYLEATMNAVTAILNGYSASSEYFTCDIIAQTVFPDETSDQWSYGSIRVNYVISNP